jgi:hypothetical protein
MTYPVGTRVTFRNWRVENPEIGPHKAQNLGRIVGVLQGSYDVHFAEVRGRLQPHGLRLGDDQVVAVL